MVNVLEEICQKAGKEEDGFVKGIIIELNRECKSLQDIKGFCRKEEQTIEQEIPYLATTVHEHKPLFKIRPFLERITSEIIKVYKSVFGEEIHIYLLFDESSATPIECQEVINITLQRGYPYRTKLATRPYEWNTLNALDGPSLEIDSDFKLLQVEYLNKDEDAYRGLLKEMTDTMIMTRAIKKEEEGWLNLNIDHLGIKDLLNDTEGEYSGFDRICKVSSGGILRFLLLCSEMFSVADDEEGEFLKEIFAIRHQIQDKVVKRYSKEQLFWNIDRIEKGEEIQNLCKALLKKIKDEEFKGSFIEISPQAQQLLFEDGFLEDKMGEKLKPAFTHGFFRFLDKNSGNFWRVPSTFSINKVLFPRYDLGLEEGEQPLVIDQEFIERFFRPIPRQPAEPSKEPAEDRKLSAFLSTSLSEYHRDQREAIKEALLLRHNIKCSDIKDLSKGQFILDNIIKHIKKHDFAIVDLTEMRPNVALELGVCAELTKPAICIFNQASKIKMEDMPEWMLLFSITPYKFEPEELNKMALKVKDEAIMMWSEKRKEFINKEFIKTGRFGSPLRSKKIQQNFIYFSYPPDRGIWKEVYPRIETHFEKVGYKIINEGNAPFIDANVLQRPICCASLAKYIFIDTTDLKNNLLQSYKLGVGGVMSKAHHTMRIEEEREADQKASLWIEPYGTWNNTEDLITLMENFIKST
ncbi:MAG: hypothetical protein QME07_05690 [bacterium]|nr:hypothetical protein [bacterium]